MALNQINVGAAPNDGTGDPLRTAFQTVNSNFLQFSAVALSGAYADLSGKPALATVATTGAYADLSGKPALATVATTGAYNDLTGKPALATVATTGAYSDLSGRPTLAAVATSGAYSDLSGQPSLFNVRPKPFVGLFYPAFPAVMGGGSTVIAGTIRLIPLVAPATCTILNLSVVVGTLAAGGNCQLALYASDTTTGKPTGNALGSTASISTAATGAVNADMGGSVQLIAGTLYWLAINCDNSTNLFVSPTSTFNSFPWLVGSATIAGALSAAAETIFLSVTQTFGTWPSLTSASITETTAKGAMIAYKIASVP